RERLRTERARLGDLVLALEAPHGRLGLLVEAPDGPGGDGLRHAGLAQRDLERLDGVAALPGSDRRAVADEEQVAIAGRLDPAGGDGRVLERTDQLAQQVAAGRLARRLVGCLRVSVRTRLHAAEHALGEREALALVSG